MRVLVLHGPNLNLLGTREPAIYGGETLAEVDVGIRRAAERLGLDVEIHQSNHEGGLVEALHAARGICRAVVLNAGGYTHTSVALRDAILAVGLPTVEVHLSNLASREEFRHRSLLAAVCVGTIQGFGGHGYVLALDAIAHFLETPSESRR